MTLNEFYTKLGFHDWYYQYSDDHRVWRNGQDNWDRLNEVAKESPEHWALFEAYASHVFSQTPKPERPA